MKYLITWVENHQTMIEAESEEEATVELEERLMGLDPQLTFNYMDDDIKVELVT